jgi:hypothetical protein
VAELKRARYNAEQFASRQLGQCASVPPPWRHENGLGWDKVGFYYTHRQYAEVHVVPINDLRPHAEECDCWCHPVEYEPNTWGHFALDRREDYECGDLSVH